MNQMKVSMLVMLFAAGLAGCASSPIASQTPEQRVAERALTYWQAVIANDFHGTYALMTPGYRERYSYEKHVLRSRPIATFLSADVKSVTCATEERCAADVAVTFKNLQGVRMPPGTVDDTVINEKWIKIGGDWWRILAQ